MIPITTGTSSGTLPQVAADYRISTYFRDPRGIYVNLYLPSSVRWIQDGANVSLRQSGAYPFGDSVSFELTASFAKEFSLSLRIPEWAQGARTEVNGKRWPDPPEPGTFTTIFRQWRNGDHLDLHLPRKMRLEPIDLQHPDVVALLCGPMVLFAVTDPKDKDRPLVTRAQLLGATPGKHTWQTLTGRGPIKLLPYVEIDEQQYSTYLKVT
jgi:DUF1680 family protein